MSLGAALRITEATYPKFNEPTPNVFESDRLKRQDIDFTAAQYDATGQKTANARLTVTHNGTVIHTNVELPDSTTAAPVKEANTPGPIYLQNHGNPVRYRNIWVLPKP